MRYFGPGRFALAFSLLVLSFVVGAGAQAGGPLVLTVDATQSPLKILHIQMSMPAQPGPMTLLYPKWIPGEHEPDGPIGNVTGLHFTGNGKAIPWTRDTLDAFTFHLTIPAGVSTLHVAFDYIEASSGEYTSGGSATDKLIDLNWNQDLLYPAGVPVKHLEVLAKLILPPFWQFGTALPVAQRNGDDITFQSTTLNTLVDSPVIAGQYYHAYNITPPGEPIHHELDIVADSPEALALPPQVQQDMTNLVAETGKMFGSRHYRDYHFLLTLSNHVSHFGLEHHESDDSRLPERALLGGDPGGIVGELLPHEFVHSWNGKFRRPADLASTPFEAPMQDDMLWVYEGLTNFLGHVLATRSGLWTESQYRQELADIAAELGPGRPGRTWRDLQDTATAVPAMFENGDEPWINWRRDTDYYEEGDLLWLQVATIIHDRSHGQKSFDDFLRLFYGGPNNGPQLKTYTFNDLVAALNQIVPYDWASFFHRRLTSLSATPPLGGIEASGWKYELVNGWMRSPGNLVYSIGLDVAADGTVRDSIVGGPAYKAGVVPGMKILGVNQRLFTPQRLDDAVAESPATKSPIALLIVNDDYISTALVSYHGGPKVPRLVRNGKSDYLDQFLSPRAN